MDYSVRSCCTEKERGLPTSNWIITRPYHKDLIGRSKNQGMSFFNHIGIDREDKVARDEDLGKKLRFLWGPCGVVHFYPQITR